MIQKNQEQIINRKDHLLHSGECLPLLHFNAFDDYSEIRHGFSTRLGGVSKGEFSSLNLSFTRGDDEKAVMENYRRIAEVFATSPSSIVTSDQTHTTNVRLVTGDDAGKGITRPRDYSDIDGLITKERGLLLATFYADCVPLYFYDPIHHAIGLSHSGWKGTLHRMGNETIHAMHENFGSNPKDILAAIGPSICLDCYEVSEELAGEFRMEFPDEADSILKPGRSGHAYLDLWKANEIVLLDAGIRKEHLSVTNICTCCNSKLLFSHRASQGRRGNLGAFLMLQ